MKHILLLFLCIAVLRTTNAMIFETERTVNVWENPMQSFSAEALDSYQVRNDLTVFPNPASVEFSIRFDIGDKNNVTISLFDALGREVKTFERNVSTSDSQVSHFSIDQRMPNGRYFIKVEADGKQFVKSLIIKH